MIIASINLDQSLGDSGCPCKAPWTDRTALSGISGSLGNRDLYHSLYGLSIVTNKGAFGAPASANALAASAPITTELLIAVAAQKTLEAD